MKAAKLTPAITTTDAADHVVETFNIVMPDDVVAVTHNGSNIANPRPVGIALFDEPALQSGLLLVGATLALVALMASVVPAYRALTARSGQSLARGLG